jgi:hypothetical protein
MVKFLFTVARIFLLAIILAITCFTIQAQESIAFRFTMGAVVPTGHELSKGYKGGLALEPSLKQHGLAMTKGTLQVTHDGGKTWKLILI